MFSKRFTCLQAIFLAVLAIGLLGWNSLALAVGPAHAQSEKLENDASCMACHENLYLLYDTGKAYCFCGTRARCTYCHGGVLGALDKEVAHQGLIAHPTENNAAVCQSCHPEDYQQRVEKFAASGGIRPTPLAVPGYTPPAPVENSAALPAAPMKPWQKAGFSFLLVGFTGLVFFAVRCYRDDCANHRL